MFPDLNQAILNSVTQREGGVVNKLNNQNQVDDLNFKAAQLASFLVMLSTLALIGLYAYWGQNGLVFAFKDIFPESTYKFVLVILLGFGLLTFSTLFKQKLEQVTFKNAFLHHLCILSGMAIVLLGLFSKVI